MYIDTPCHCKKKKLCVSDSPHAIGFHESSVNAIAFDLNLSLLYLRKRKYS